MGETHQTDLRDLWGGDTWRSWGDRAHGPRRPTAQERQLPPTLSSRLSWALSDPRWSWSILTCLNWVLEPHLVHLSLNRCSDIFCDFMSFQSVLATCILAQKHILHILKSKVWFRDLLDKDACKKCKLSWFSDQVDAYKWSLVSVNSHLHEK